LSKSYFAIDNSLSIFLKLNSKLEVAQNMLKQGMALEIVIACTGLTEAELK